MGGGLSAGRNLFWGFFGGASRSVGVLISCGVMGGAGGGETVEWGGGGRRWRLVYGGGRI